MSTPGGASDGHSVMGTTEAHMVIQEWLSNLNGLSEQFCILLKCFGFMSDKDHYFIEII